MVLLPFNCRGHELEEPSGYKCAVKDGLADYGGSLAQPGRYSLENRRIDPPSGRGAVVPEFHQAVGLERR